jgi:hypothetical protein
MASAIIIRCPSCLARIKAPVQLVGQARACPGCGHLFVVAAPGPTAVAPSLLARNYRLAAGGRWPTRRQAGR